VTKLTGESAAQAETIEESVVFFPNPFLKNNVDVVDTPGLSDEAAMTDVTLGVIPEVDAAILVVMATSPFAHSEARFLENLLVDHGLARVLFVVTAMDRIASDDQRQRLLASIRDRIRGRIQEHAGRRFGEGTDACDKYLARVGEPKVFGISGFEALRGKAEHDDARLEESGFLQFEAFLEEFLTEERGLIALRTHVERVLQLCIRLEESLRSWIDSSEPTLTAPDRERATAFLLDAVEASAQRGLDEVEKLAGQGQELATRYFSELPERLRAAAESGLSGLTIRPEDLEPERFAVFLHGSILQLAAQMLERSQRHARSLTEQLAKLWRRGVLLLLELRTVSERVLLHLEAGAEAKATETEGGASPSGAPRSFDLEREVDGAVAALFGPSGADRSERILSAFRLSESWSSSVRVESLAGPQLRFMKKALDLVRIEKLKSDLKSAVLQAVEADLARHAEERWRGLLGQLEEDFSRLREGVSGVRERIRERRSGIRRRQERRSAEEEGRRRQHARALSELDTIRHQIRDVHDELAALG